MVFSSNHEGNWEIYSRAASAAGALEPVLRRPLDQGPQSIAPDGTLLFAQASRDTGADLWMLPKGGQPEPWLVTSAEEEGAVFRTDGLLVAYESNTSGRTEVYVQARAAGGPRIQMSVDGGNTPVWSLTDDRLFFRNNNAMMAATINARSGLSAGKAGDALRRRVDAWRRRRVRAQARRQKLPDDQEGPEAIPTRIDLVLNWFGELTRRTSRK